MAYRFYIYFYLVASVFFAAYLISSIKPRRYFVNYMITVWFLITPIVNSRIFRLINPLMRYTGRTWRINLHFGVFLSGILLLRALTVRNPDKLKLKKTLTYEKFLYFYLFGSMTLWYIHYTIGNLRPDYLNIRLMVDYTAIILYFSLTKHIDKDTVKCIMKSIIFMSVISTFFCFPQFFYDRWIMRTDRMAFAFADYRRSSGIFVAPHDHSMFVASALFMTDLSIKNKPLKYSLMAFFVSGIILTFNRATWIGVVIAVFFYLNKYYRQWLSKKVMVLLFLPVIAFFLYKTFFDRVKETVSQTDVYQQRLASDTGTQRVMLWNMGIEVLQENVIVGLGDKIDNPVYYKMMYVIGGRDWAMGRRGGIHNLFLEELVHKGIFIPIFLLLFFVYFFKHIVKENKDKNMFYIAVFAYTTVYATFQQFGASFVNANNGILIIFYAAMASAIYYKNIDISEFSLEGEKTKLNGNSD